MAERKTERLINLVIALLATPRFLTREQLRQRVEDYAGRDDQSFQRMFERDKEQLRELGIVVLTGPTDLLSDENDGYRIQPDSYYLPDIHLTALESTLVGLASTVWAEPAIAAEVHQGVAKLRAAGEPVAPATLGTLVPRLTAREQAFPLLWQALMERRPVEFTYHDRLRQVNPWRLTLRFGAWYLIGQETGGGDDDRVRIFKLARMTDRPRVGQGSFAAPDPALVAAKAKTLEPPAPTAEALLAIRHGLAGELRRRGRPVDQPAPMGYDLVVVPYARGDELVASVVEAGADAVVLAPAELRQGVIAALEQIAGVGHEHIA